MKLGPSAQAQGLTFWLRGNGLLDAARQKRSTQTYLVFHLTPRARGRVA